uniref:Uncharacterized protein n=1 Tax=Globisporangium ultimum (strain ATCC 200006 / CBS 805.95 / DAOM BR144) TaxID=431595 RepID=K3W890_GLOUD
MATKQIFNDLNLVIRLNQHIKVITNNDEATTALLSKQTSFKVLTDLDALQNPDPREDARFDHQRSSFLAQEDFSDLPFHLQGDQEFNKASAIAERRALRRSDPIKRKIAFLWDVARRNKGAEIVTRAGSFQQHVTKTGGHGSPSSLVAADIAANNMNSIGERDYMAMMLLIFKALRNDFVLDVAQLQVHCDWEVDSHHGNTLSFDQFFLALFELVDLWTCDIMESTYVHFLKLLARRITVRVVMFLDDMKLKLALSDNFDDAVVVKAIPLSTIPKFVSVAKVVEQRGVRTVGELATADPQMVENERLKYIEKNNFSKEKIGATLQQLLDTFNGISEQLEPGESGIINSLRTAFIIEKGIFIHRKHDIDSVRAELEKFGVDPVGLSDADALEKYGTLYEMFVLRDGESIKTLAQTMLTQIKLELEAHGIVVNDENAETMYDGFYNSVVAATGDDMVRDAKNWMNETVKTNTVSSYVKADYHEFKSLEDVTLTGSQPGDEEFMSLLSSEDEEVNDDMLPIADDGKLKNASPIQRKPSQVKITQVSSLLGQTQHPTKKNAERQTRENPEKPTSTPPGSSSSPRQRSGPRADPHSKDSQSHRKHSGDKWKNSKGREAHEQSQTKPGMSTPSLPRPADKTEDEGGTSSEILDSLSREGAETSLDGSNELSLVEGTSSENAGDSTLLDDRLAQSSPTDQDEETRRIRPSLSLKTMRSKSDLDLELPSQDLERSDTTNDDTDREAQGVEFEYEGKGPSMPEPEPIPVQETPVAPKIPKIIIGTGADGVNIPAAARYIQLLGLGTVLTAGNEAGLYQLLDSDEGKDVDLVCFDIGAELDTAVEKLLALQNVIGKRVIIFGGDIDDPEKTHTVAEACLAEGAVFFSTLPINFAELRTVIVAFFENSTQPYILRQRKPVGQATAALKMASQSIGAASLFGLHDNPRKLSTPP